MTGPPEALLPPRLATTAARLGPGLRRVRSGSRRGELGGDDLVHDGGVRLDAEDVRSEVDLAAADAFGVVELGGERVSHSSPPLG